MSRHVLSTESKSTMSLPDNLRQQLLSASIDNALSDDERDQLEQWLLADPELQRERQEWLRMTSDLRAGLSELRTAKLDIHATDRIVTAAMGTGKWSSGEGRGERVSTASVSLPNPTTSPAAGMDRSLRRSLRFAIGLATAASLFFVLVRWLPDRPGPSDSTREMAARSDDGLGESGQDRLVDGSHGSEGRLRVAEPTVTANDPIPERENIGGSSNLAVEESIDPTGRMQLDRQPGRLSLPSESASNERLADGGSPMDRIPPGGDPTTSEPPLDVLLVIAVELTPLGEQTLALHQALREADIRLAESGVLRDELIETLKDADVFAADVASQASGVRGSRLYFVEASARRLDQFLIRVMSDEDSFAAVGLSLATEPPLMAAISQLRAAQSADASDRPSEAAMARSWVAADGQPLLLNLDRDFIPMAGMAPAGGSGITSLSTHGGDADAPSQMLLLVR